MPFLMACAIGIVAGLLRRGGSALGRTLTFTGMPLMISLLFTQAVFRNLGQSLGLDRPSATLLWAMGGLGLTLVAILNSRVPGILLVGLGVVANAAVVAVSGGMPVRAALPLGQNQLPFMYTPVGGGTALSFGDIIPARLPILGEYLLSVGDVLMLMGTAVFFASVTSAVLENFRVQLPDSDTGV